MVLTPNTSSGSSVAFGTVACAVTLRDDELLLLQRSESETFLSERWTLPAGKLQPGESPEVAALRELHEEAGLSGELVRATGESSFQSIYLDRLTEWTQFNFLVRVHGSQEVVLDTSHRDHQWFPIAELARLAEVVDAYTVKVIEQAIPYVE
jgi:8-oxo-dGTP pyrophosphatase MutT (NUDIX family)